mmetsp:Transcript_96915/g.278374  ORF Transcript_96915/g.278374 Transcript_96915/m.278374 type:complete len:332 (-) Transcript_96915:1095-2090(-)
MHERPGKRRGHSQGPIHGGAPHVLRIPLSKLELLLEAPLLEPRGAHVVQGLQAEVRGVLGAQRAQQEIRLGILGALHRHVVAHALQEYPLEGVDLVDGVEWAELGKLDVLKGLVVPDLRRQHHGSDDHPPPVVGCQRDARELVEALEVMERDDAHLRLEAEVHHHVPQEAVHVPLPWHRSDRDRIEGIHGLAHRVPQVRGPRDRQRRERRRAVGARQLRELLRVHALQALEASGLEEDRASLGALRRGDVRSGLAHRRDDLVLQGGRQAANDVVHIESRQALPNLRAVQRLRVLGAAGGREGRLGVPGPCRVRESPLVRKQGALRAQARDR